MNNSYIQEYTTLLENLDQQSLRRKLKVSESATAPLMRINGRTMLTFCSNDYLGLANHQDIAIALSEGAQLFGGGSGASHMISGHSKAHHDLEQALASTQEAHIPDVKALFFSTGYMANIAAITALSSGLKNKNSSEQMTIYSEELNHASLIDGLRLADKQNGASIKIYPHQDLDTLRSLLKQDNKTHKLIVSDAVFSMDGNIAKLDELMNLAEEFNALLLIDDAHGFGVLGQSGHGILDLFQVSRNDPRAYRIIYMGTLGKAAGVSGAFVAAHSSITEWIMQKGRAYIYTTASPALIAHGLLKSLQLMSDSSHRIRLNKNIEYWKKNLHLKHWKLLPSDTAIQPIIIGSNENALKAAKELDLKNIWVPAIRPPTVPEGSSRLRVTLSATHTQDQIDTLIQAIHDIEHI
jgi:8-amino-7-oxononanoate synthase